MIPSDLIVRTLFDVIEIEQAQPAIHRASQFCMVDNLRRSKADLSISTYPKYAEYSLQCEPFHYYAHIHTVPDYTSTSYSTLQFSPKCQLCIKDEKCYIFKDYATQYQIPLSADDYFNLAVLHDIPYNRDDLNSILTITVPDLMFYNFYCYRNPS